MSPDNLDGPGGRRTRGLHNLLSATLASELLWNEYGVDNNIVVRSLFYFLKYVRMIYMSVISHSQMISLAQIFMRSYRQIFFIK